MNKNFWLAGLCGLIFSTAASAMPLPPELMYQQKPVDSLCFEELENSAQTTQLGNCGVQAEKGRYVSGSVTKLAAEGYTGYEFKEKDTGPVAGYSYYKAIASLNDGVLIYTINSGGGSGEFTALQWVTRKGETLTIETLNKGDRCNNGIEDVSAKAGVVTYTINITPYDFFTLTGDNPHHLRAYDDLPACAACCAAKAVFSRPLDKNYGKQKLLYVDFSNYSLAPTDDPGATRYQQCYSKLIGEARAKGQARFTAEELHAFVKNYNETCFPKK